MSRLLLATLFIALANEVLGGLLPGDGGYQYDRPGFGGDFGRHAGDAATGSRFPGRVAGFYGAPSGTNQGAAGSGSFNRQPGGYGFAGSQRAYPAYQGFQGNIQSYQGYQGDGGAGYQGFDGVNSGRQPSLPYSFEYEVRDPATGNDYGQRESADAGGAVRGEYRVLLPDSRTQIVRYTADDANGYVADVRYEGEVQQFGRPGFFGGGGGGAANRPFFPGGAPGFQLGRGGGGNGGGYNSGASTTPGDGFGYASSNRYLPPGAAGSYGK